jgi:acylphosphatase
VKLHYSILVTGKVQGVFYRASARQKADQLNITGFAHNQRDGSVLVEAEGEEASLKEFVSWCRKGPANAIFEDVVVTEKENIGYLSFTVK